MKNFILWGGICLLISTTQCFAQEKVTAIYAVYPYTEIENEQSEWSITLPEQPTATTESYIESVERGSTPFTDATLVINHAGKISYYEADQEEFTLWGHKEAQVTHAFKTPIPRIQSVWEQNFSGLQRTFFDQRKYEIKSTRMGTGSLNIEANQTEISLTKTFEQITETGLQPYRKVRVCHYFWDGINQLPLFQTVTDTLYVNEGKDYRVISFSLYRKQITTGIESSSSENGWQVYPNPTRGEFTIDNKDPEPSTLEIYDLSGKLQKVVPLKNGCNEISISHLSAGTYLLKQLSRKSCNSMKLFKL